MKAFLTLVFLLLPSPSWAFPISDSFAISVYLGPQSIGLGYYEAFGGLTPGEEIIAITTVDAIAHFGDLIERLRFEAILDVVLQEAYNGGATVSAPADPPIAETPEPFIIFLLGSEFIVIGFLLRKRLFLP